MKKKIFALMLVGAMTISLVACGEKKAEEEAKSEETVAEATETTEAKEDEVLDCTYNCDDYVTLGDYKGIEVTLSGQYDFSEEGLNNYINEQVTSKVGYVKDEEATLIQEDSIVNVDYVGSQDGVAFDGGSAEDQMLDVKNNASTSGTGFIDGFTSGLVGHSVGEEVAYEVTFPENYGSAALAGQTVIFTFKVNYIAKQADATEITDDNISSYFSEYATKADFEKGMEEAYNQSLEDSLKSDTESAVISAVVANATVNGCPENLVQARIDSYIAMMETYLNGYTFEEYVTSMGADYESYLAEMKSSLTQSVQQQMIFEAIAKAENITIDDTEYKDYISNIMTQNSLTDEEQFYSNYSIGNLDGKEYFKTIYLADKAIDFCLEKAVVNR